MSFRADYRKEVLDVLLKMPNRFHMIGPVYTISMESKKLHV